MRETEPPPLVTRRSFLALPALLLVGGISGGCTKSYREVALIPAPWGAHDLCKRSPAAAPCR